MISTNHKVMIRQKHIEIICGLNQNNFIKVIDCRKIINITQLSNHLLSHTLHNAFMMGSLLITTISITTSIRNQLLAQRLAQFVSKETRYRLKWSYINVYRLIGLITKVSKIYGIKSKEIVKN